ncbi:Crossover junction endonuclease mus81 [Spiromyces aspiralis]|uniref:Crossover junction endonuclease mus81 n=1 Tax=Spiromyces aspiralis TaxID=68401 RepID=A0ACC1HEU7_9FUNG|nr:Crossover junction endonuclease mus81 [Spiromyces aspiralis]
MPDRTLLLPLLFAGERPAVLADDNLRGSQGASRRPRAYIPRYRSGAFAILIALLKFSICDGPDAYLHKLEIIECAQPYCDTSFEVPKSGTKYTAWGAIKTLEAKDLVYRQGAAAKYMLSEVGHVIARQMVKVLRDNGGLTADDEDIFSRLDCIDANRALPSHHPGSQEERRIVGADESFMLVGTESRRDKSVQRPPSLQPLSGQEDPKYDLEDPESTAHAVGEAPIVYEPGTFDVVLIMDNREIRTQADRSYMAREFERRGVRFEARTLTVGDYLWVAQPRARSLQRNQPNKELVIDYVVERKRMDDLCASIRDGRLKEQHFRIKNRGFERVVYVLEGDNPEAVQKIGEQTVYTSLSQIQVIEGSLLKRTASFDDTISYLDRLTRQIKRKFEVSPLRQLSAAAYSISVLCMPFVNRRFRTPRTQGNHLHLIPDAAVDPSTITRLKQALKLRWPDREYCLSYDGYIHATSKSGAIRLRDVFAKMLLTTRGLSAEKVATILKEHSTPAEFIEEIGKGPDAKSQVERIKQIGTTGQQNLSTKRLGQAMAKRLHEIWFSESYTDITQ